MLNREDTFAPPRPHKVASHPDSIAPKFSDAFIDDICLTPQKALVQSLQQLENRWSVDSTEFKLYRPVTSLDLAPIGSLWSATLPQELHDVGCKVLPVRNPKSKEVFVFKTIEQSKRGWRRMYHELRQLLCIPPHANIIGAPKALVYIPTAALDMAGDIYNLKRRYPICGFALPLIPGHTLKAELEKAPVSLTLARRKMKAKWCRQLASALLHITRHGNGPGRPGYYSDLKPDNIMLTGEGADVVLIDFEQAGNHESFIAEEIMDGFETVEEAVDTHCDGCEAVGLGRHSCSYVPDRDDDFSQPAVNPVVAEVHPASGSVHPNTCSLHWTLTLTNPANRAEVPKNVYTNPPYGYYSWWTRVGQEARERAMVYSLSMVCQCIIYDSNTAMTSNPSPGMTSSTRLIPGKVATMVFRHMASTFPCARPGMGEVLGVFCGWERRLANEVE